jgi:hypothetical protein
MKGWIRTASILAVLGTAAGAVAEAQIPIMPLFVNPRYTSGFRVHVDVAETTDSLDLGNIAVVQAGATFAIGPVGMAANVGSSKADLAGLQACQANPNDPACGDKKVTLSALAQLRVAGGGVNPLALSIFGGASLDLNGWEAAGSSLPQSLQDSLGVKILTIPVGVSVGYKLGPLTVWGAPRYVFRKGSNCGSTPCPANDNGFAWSVGADLPLLGILAVRGAYNSGQINGETLNSVGLGASVGFGGVH